MKNAVIAAQLGLVVSAVSLDITVGQIDCRPSRALYDQAHRATSQNAFHLAIEVLQRLQATVPRNCRLESDQLLGQYISNLRTLIAQQQSGGPPTPCRPVQTGPTSYSCYSSGLPSPVPGLQPPASLPPQLAERIVVGRDVFAFHAELLRDYSITLEAPAVQDAEIFVELIGLSNFERINALGLQIRRSPGLNYALGFENRGYRTIVYDPQWAATERAEAYLAISHEAGHHFCGHTVSTIRQDRWQRELEADQFAGASIRRFEIYHGRPFFDAVLAAATRRYSEQGDAGHPPRAMRLEALRRGYQQGSPCGGLAPVTQRGFTSGIR